MILYIHGFASCGSNNKSRTLIAHYGAKQVLAPDLSHKPAIAIQQLEALLKQHHIELMFGSSLGGFYATYLNARSQPIPAVLIHPVVAPLHLLDEILGQHQGCQGHFEITDTHIQQLIAYRRTALKTEEHYKVLLKTGDEVLDYQQAAEFYAEKDVVITQGGNHRFENLADYLADIDHWHKGL